MWGAPAAPRGHPAPPCLLPVTWLLALHAGRELAHFCHVFPRFPVSFGGVQVEDEGRGGGDALWGGWEGGWLCCPAYPELGSWGKKGVKWATKTGENTFLQPSRSRCGEGFGTAPTLSFSPGFFLARTPFFPNFLASPNIFSYPFFSFP